MRRGLGDADALTLNDQDSLGRRQKTPGTKVLRHCPWPWPFTRKLRPHQHGKSDLGSARQTCQSLHRHRCSDIAQLRDLGNVKVLTVLELLLQVAADERETMKLGGPGFKLGRQPVNCRHQCVLVSSEFEIHQRGSRGSPSSSLAIRLSWISAAPEAMPATIAR